MDEIVKQIIDYSRHKFVYLNHLDTYYFKNAIDNYSLNNNINEAIPIYIRNEYLPVIDNGIEDNRKRILSFLWQYYEFLLSYQIINTLTNHIDMYILNDKLAKLLARMSKYNKIEIKGIHELKRELKNSLDIYRDTYLEYIKTMEHTNFLDKMHIPFISTELFVPQVKEALGMEKHFSILLDCLDGISTYSQKTINNYLGSRCNGDISMNILCKKDTWNTYLDIGNNYIQNIHDFIEIDIAHEKQLIKK